MNIERYSYKANKTYLEYEFFSEGPKGRIRKVVQYSKIEEEDATFNLGFGDINEETGFVSDVTISNNNDRDKVLSTVASTVFDFILHYPGYSITLEGSTQSRTRLYQMAISANLDYLNTLFFILGLINNEYELFRKNINYDAFLVIPK